MITGMLAAVLLGASQTPQIPPVAPPVARAEIWNTEQFVLPSTVLGRDVLIQVGRPMRPQSDPVPAVYLLDGNLSFPMVVTGAMLAPNMNQLGPAYFIGVSDPRHDVGHWGRERGRDLVHVDLTGRPQARTMSSGEGARFERFLVEELKPLIEARYPTDPERTVLAGHSLGGLFVAHVLINNPGAFRDYLIGSPSLWAEPGLIEAAAAMPARATPGRVFIGVGGEEDAPMIDGADALAAALRSGGSGLTVEYWRVPDENHFSVSPSLYRRGLRFLLPPLAPPPPP